MNFERLAFSLQNFAYPVEAFEDGVQQDRASTNGQSLKGATQSD